MNQLVLNTGLFKNSSGNFEKLRFLILLLLVFSLPYAIIYSSLLFFTLCALTLLDLNKSKFRKIPKQIWLFQLIYFLGVIGYFYSLNKPAAGFLLERQLTILLLPVIIPLAINIDEDRVRWTLFVLVLTSVYATLYLLISMTYTITMDLKMPYIKTMFSGAFFNHQFSKPLEIHAGYLSMYLSLSVFYLVSVFYKIKRLFGKILVALSLLILFVGLFFLASRNTLIATFFTLVLIFPLFNSANKIRYILISFSSLAVCMLIIYNVPYLHDRFFTELISDIKPLQNGKYVNYSGTEPRIERWKCALELIKKSPIIGYGTGDEIDILKTGYMEKRLFISYLENFNAHNQYLSYLLKNGIIGLAVFLFAFYYYGSLAIKNRDFMYLAFLLLLLIGFYTENILDANKGIVFFALFNTLFGYNILDKRKKDTNSLR